MKKSLSTVCAVLAALGLAATATPAQASPRHDRQPTATARQAGITRLGGGYAGWEQHTQPGAATGRTTAVANRVTDAVQRTRGIDVSTYQGNVNWSAQWNDGVRWAYTKATEGTYYTNDYFAQQYVGSYNAGMIRGAYHFANPAYSSAVSQADYFVAHGGGWSRDGQTLPGMLDIEYNPYGATCYGKSAAQMVSWIKAFLNEYRAKTGRDAVIYTTNGWWRECTGNSTAFNSTNPLWVARYGSSAGTLPGGWPYYTMWQYTDSPIDHDLFNGDLSRVRALANG